MAVNQKSGSGIAGDTLDTKLNIKDGDAASISDFGSCAFIYTLSEEVSNRMVEILQDFFKNYPLGRAFNDNLKKVNKEVCIVPAYADHTQNVPQVTVEAMPVDSVPIAFGNRMGNVSYEDHVYYSYAGMAAIAATLSIRDTGKRDVARLADVVFLALMQFVPYHMSVQFINVRPQIKFTNPIKETGSKLGGDVFLAKLTVTLDVEWRQYMEILAPTIENIVITSTPEQ